MTTKRCTRCGIPHPLDYFYADKRMKDGRRNRCRGCIQAVARKRRWAQMETRKGLVYWRARNRSHRPKHETQRDRRDFYAVYNAVKQAVRDGRLVPALACEDCGHDFSDSGREAHHKDYTKPLEVEWLCSLCHGKRHRRQD